MRIAAVIMLLIFFVCAAVQYNDPDPIRWILLYGAGAVVSALAIAKKYTVLAPVLLVVYMGIAIYLMPTWNPGELFQILQQPKMMDSDHRIELAREAVGLVIGAVWMAVLTWAWWRGRNELVRGGSGAAIQTQD